MRLLIEAGREVLCRPAYLLLAATIAIIVLVATLWLPNYRLIGAVFTTPGVALGTKLQLLASSVGGLASNFGAVAAVTTAIIPLLFAWTSPCSSTSRDSGARVWRAARSPRAWAVRRAVQSRLVAWPAVRFCCCRSFLSSGAAGALALLPLGGAELGLVSIALLLLSIYLIARKIAVPPVCALPPATHQPPTRNTP